jgi:hypothetical protein
MIARHWNHHWARLFVLAAAVAAAVWLAPRPATAGTLDKLDTSLKLIPADASFYASTLHNREKIEAIRHSNAWAKIMGMPAVQMAIARYKEQLDTPGSNLAQVDAALKNPEIQKILGLLADMGSDEVFMYGDKSCVDFVDLFQTVNVAQTYGPILAQITGEAEGRQPNELQGGAVLSALAHNPKLIAVPNFIMGFKLKNAELAKEELAKLEVFASMMLETNDKTKGHFKKTKIDGHDYLVLNLDGGMVPWDLLPLEKLKEMEAEEGDAQKVVNRLKELKLVVALGLRDNYLLVSIGSSADCLKKLGQGQRLIDRAELKPLEKFVDKRLVSIGYVSETLSRQANGQKKNLDNLRELAKRWLKSADLSEEQKQKIGKDVQDLAKDVKDMMPEPGAMMGLSFLVDHGVESYQYAWGGHGCMDGSQPLGLLEHVGGNPLVGAVARHKPLSVQNYDKAVKWAAKAYGYFKEFGLPAMPGENREKVEKFLEAALPLAQRLDKANRELLIPALADGQVALVIDDKLASKHFADGLPETEKPMPMIEPAIVVGISNAKLLKKGMSEYRAVINGLIDAVRQIEGSDAVPEDFQVPEPKMVEDSLRTIYSFIPPGAWGVDEKIEPNIGVSEKVAVFSASRDHTERLLKAASLGVGGVLGAGERPLAGAGWVQWAALVKAAAPWADFAAEQIMNSQEVDDAQRKPITDQVHTVLDVLQALRTVTSESYLEDGVLVTHTSAEIRDVAK